MGQVKPHYLLQLIRSRRLRKMAGKYCFSYEGLDKFMLAKIVGLLRGRRNKGAEALKNLGNKLLAQGEFERAEACYRDSISVNPAYADAYNNLGFVLWKRGLAAEAGRYLDQAILLDPGLANAHFNLAMVLQGQGDWGRASTHLSRALELEPGLYNNLGIALTDQGKLDEAAASFQKALSFRPDDAEANYNLGVVLEAQWKLDEAMASYRRALALRPDHAETHNNIGVILYASGEVEAALDCYRRAFQLKPDYADAYSNYLLSSQYVIGSSSSARFADHLAFAERFEAPLRAHWPICLNDRDARRQLRVGLVSGDFRTHPIGYFLDNVLACLDRKAFRLSLYSTYPTVDALTERLRSMAFSWTSVAGMSGDKAARIIGDDGMDILVDLSGHTAHNGLLIFAHKPAPVQVTWIGYPGTTGLQAMDYILCDRQVIPPEEAEYYVEKPYYLPDCYLCFTPPREDLPVGALPALRNGFVTFGCFNSLTKMNDTVVALWARVLQSVPGSRLFLKCYQFNSVSMRRAVLSSFAAAGIGAERLLLEGPSPRSEYLSKFNDVDIALDPFPFPGGTTTVEGLWMGVPVINHRGDRFISHAGGSILHAAGLTDWIAASDDDYVAKAVAYSDDLERLAELRFGLRSRLLASPLCDAQRFANNLGIAFRNMWRTYCSQVRASRP